MGIGVWQQILLTEGMVLEEQTFSADGIARIIKEVFGNIENVGGTKSSPIWRIRKMAD